MLVYRLRELEDELAALTLLVGDLVVREGPTVLRQLHTDLVTFRHDSCRSSFLLVVPELRPLETMLGPLLDRHHARRNSIAKISLHAKLDRVIGDPDRVELTEAKTTVAIEDFVSKAVLKKFRFGFDAGRVDGAYFHVVLHDVDILPPMLPTAMTSPFAAIELALCELFPGPWISAVQSGEAGYNWRSIQKRRVDLLQAWQVSLSTGVTSPWITIRTAKPTSTLFA